MSRAAYEIRAVGEVPRALLEDFEGVTVSIDPAGSTIHAVLADEAELHGLLDALSRGGFVLIDVTPGAGRTTSPEDPPRRPMLPPPDDPSRRSTRHIADAGRGPTRAVGVGTPYSR